MPSERTDDTKYKYTYTSREFLKRAEENISKFDDTKAPKFLFYAALELRFGIESRLNDYIQSSRKQQKNSHKKIKSYTAKDLSKQLLKLDPYTSDNAQLIISILGSNSTILEYTPVSDELVSCYGKLSDMLHFRFFKSHKNWYYQKRLKGKIGNWSLLDYRDLLVLISEELAKANSGLLLSPPIFQSGVDEGNTNPEV